VIVGDSMSEKHSRAFSSI